MVSMFTGLIQDLGRIHSIERDDAGARLHIESGLRSDIEAGDSVAVNGVCLTATGRAPGGFEAEVMNQTLNVTALRDLKIGDHVNLELAMRASDRLGGHIVQGHVDGAGEVLAIEEDGFARRLRIGLRPELLRYAVAKGSIAINGVSLTIADLGESWVSVSLIPETLERTNLGEAKPGDKLNVECDVVAKYVERLAAPFAGKE
jgi:riboflavin synthase